MTAPLCDIDPAHGEMMPEHVYHLDGTIDTDYPMYWFCKVPDCDGFGGPIEKMKTKKKPRRERATEQLPMFPRE